MPNNKKLTNEGLPSTIKKFTDDFFDGLKFGAVNRALAKAKTVKEIPSPLIQKMAELDQLAAEMEEYIKKNNIK
jgi:hypothetical protein